MKLDKDDSVEVVVTLRVEEVTEILGLSDFDVELAPRILPNMWQIQSGVTSLLRRLRFVGGCTRLFRSHGMP